MEVILLQDVKALGKKGDIVKVSDGYGRNYILPKKLGLEATAKNLNDLKLKKQSEERLERKKLEEAKELADKLKDAGVTVAVRAGEGGRIFGSISTKEIAEAVKDQLGLELDKKKMQLDAPVKAMGSYNVTVRLHRDVTAQLTVRVTGL